MDNPINRAEYEEFKLRLDEENRRQDKRLEKIEKNIERTATLAASVEKLAINMENMLREQEKQGKRLEALECRDGEMWRKVVSYVITAIISIVLGVLFSKYGI